MEDLEFLTLADTRKKVVSYYERGFAIQAAIDLIKEQTRGDIVALKYIEPIDLNTKRDGFKKACLKGMNGGDIVVVDIEVLEVPPTEPTKYELTYKRFIIDDSKLHTVEWGWFNALLRDC